MSKTFVLVLGVLLVWFVVVKQFKVGDIPAKATPGNQIDTVGTPTTPRTYTA